MRRNPRLWLNLLSSRARDRGRRSYRPVLERLEQRALLAVYYLAPDGLDDNPGTSDAPWKTWSMAQVLVPGDTLIAKDGAYGADTGNGYPHINCAAGYRHGTEDAPITLMAENERQARIHVNRYATNGIWVRNCSYWVIAGLHVRQEDINDGSYGSGGRTLATSASHHLVIRRNLFEGSDRYECGSSVYLEDTDDSLVEENEVYGHHRHGIQLGQFFSRNNVVRRNYVNSRFMADLPGSRCRSTHGSKGDSGIVTYSADQNLIENNISENNDVGFWVIAARGGVADGGANAFLGNISLTDSGGLNFGVKTPFEAYPRDNLAADHVVVAPLGGGVAFGSGMGNVCYNCTVLDARTYGYVANRVSGIPAGPHSAYFINSLTVNAVNTGFTISAQTQWLIAYANAFGSRTAYSPSPSPYLVMTQNSDPLLGTCKVWVPDDSPMKGAGYDGADVGANVLYRYAGGFLTSTPLWDVVTGQFPVGALVPGVNDLPGRSAFDVHERLNVNTNGCAFPAGYGGGGAPSPGGAGGNPAFLRIDLWGTDREQRGGALHRSGIPGAPLRLSEPQDLRREPPTGFDSAYTIRRALSDPAGEAHLPCLFTRRGKSASPAEHEQPEHESGLLFPAHPCAAPLRQDGIPPHAVGLPDPLAPAHDADAAVFLQA